MGTCEAAAGIHLAVGCQCVEQMGIIAAQRGRANVLRSLQDNGCPGAASLRIPLDDPSYSDTDLDPVGSDHSDSEAFEHLNRVRLHCIKQTVVMKAYKQITLRKYGWNRPEE